MPLFPLPGRPFPHPALGDRMVWPAAPPAAPTDEANATPASPGAVGAAPLGAGPPTPPQPAMLPAVPTTPAAVLAATTTPVAVITTAPPPAIEAGSPAAPSRSGGRLTRFASAWVAAPPSIQTIVRRGFHWTWLSRPPRLRPPSYSQSRPDLLLPVQDWVAKGVVYPVPHQPCFQSRIFTVPRPDGRPPRIIIKPPPPSGHCSRPLGAAGGSPPYQCTGASGGPPSHFGLQPVVLSPRCVHRQRDGSVRSHAPPHLLSSRCARS